jgi:hypothetical protein
VSGTTVALCRVSLLEVAAWATGRGHCCNIGNGDGAKGVTCRAVSLDLAVFTWADSLVVILRPMTSAGCGLRLQFVATPCGLRSAQLILDHGGRPADNVNG